MSGCGRKAHDVVVKVKGHKVDRCDVRRRERKPAGKSGSEYRKQKHINNINPWKR